MDDSILCSTCHVAVRSTDYFCYNCGKPLHPKPLSITSVDQVMLYLGSIFLAPMGMVWGMRYVRQEDQKTKMVGWVAIALSTLVVIVAMLYTVKLVNTVNDQMGRGLQEIQGF